MSEPLRVDLKTIGFDLKTPCRDCPFRRDVEAHPGIAGKIGAYKAAIDTGFFTHSCHKTDPRADYPRAKKIDGKIHHCAGALILLEKMKMRQIPIGEVVDVGLVDLSDLDMSAPVFDSFEEMFHHYTPALKKRLLEHAKKHPESPACSRITEALGLEGEL